MNQYRSDQDINCSQSHLSVNNLHELSLVLMEYTVKFDIPDQFVPLVKFFKNPLYQEIRYIENKFIIDYNNPFQTSIPLYRGFTYGPVYRRSGISNFTVYTDRKSVV